MRFTQVNFGTPGNRPVMFFHVAPSFRDRQAVPASVPAESRPGRMGGSASAVIVQCVSAPVLSGVMPPVVCVLILIFIGSRVVRSGEMAIRFSPRLVLLSTRL